MHVLPVRGYISSVSMFFCFLSLPVLLASTTKSQKTHTTKSIINKEPQQTQVIAQSHLVNN